MKAINCVYHKPAEAQSIRIIFEETDPPGLIKYLETFFWLEASENGYHDVFKHTLEQLEGNLWGELILFLGHTISPEPVDIN